VREEEEEVRMEQHEKAWPHGDGAGEYVRMTNTPLPKETLPSLSPHVLLYRYYYIICWAIRKGVFRSFELPKILHN
jgi:hypothetical protein